MATNMLRLGVRVFLHELAGFKVTADYQVNTDTLKELFDLQNTRIIEIEQKLTKRIELAIAPKIERIETYDRACQEHKGTGYVIASSVDNVEYPSETVTTFEYCESKGLDKRLWKTFGKRYAQFVRVGTHSEPLKKKGKLLIYDNLYYYADCALRNVKKFY